MSTSIFLDGTVLIDRYTIHRFYASGSMQEVYLAHDRALDRIVVVKTPRTGVSDRRFRRGAEMGARVNHQNIAATFDYYEDDTITFMVEEFIDGVDLEKRLENEFFYLDPSLAAHVFHHIARALFEAHRMGICHRDLKPSNVMTSPDPGMATIKLTDFGIAKLTEGEINVEMERFEKDQATLTSSHTLLGAIPYLAPECWDNWTAAGKPMDIWSLGCIGYKLLAGVPPFGMGKAAIAKVIQAKLLGVKLDKPAWFGSHPSTTKLESELWSIIQSCIVPSVTERATAAQILEQCDRLCFACTERRRGVIEKFGVAYREGGKGNFGFINDGNDQWFFHGSELFGSTAPAMGQNVVFSLFDGTPKPRCSPVLLMR